MKRERDRLISKQKIQTNMFLLSNIGDYFGILMEKKVTHFPFNVIDNPMYWGSTIIFGGTALV